MDFSALNNACLDVFGDDPDVLGVSIDGTPVRAIYDSRHFAIEDGEVGSSDLITSIAVNTSDLPGPISDATIIVARGMEYRRFESRPDGQGMTVIQLERRP